MAALCKKFCAEDLEGELSYFGSKDFANKQASVGVDTDEDWRRRRRRRAPYGLGSVSRLGGN